MKTKTVKKMVYIANDGMEFNTEYECNVHEKDLERVKKEQEKESRERQLREQLKTFEIEFDDKCSFPYGDYINSDDNDYVYYYIQTPEQLSIVNEYYNQNIKHYGDGSDVEFPFMISIEINNCDTDESYFYLFNDEIKNIKEHLEPLGYTVVEKKDMYNNNDFTHENFIGDKDKIRDMLWLDKEAFLESYSYLTEEEYDNTKKILDNLLPVIKERVKKSIDNAI